MMLQVTIKILKVLDENQRKKIVILAFMMLIGAVMESVGVSLMLPLMSAILADKSWNSSWYAKIICDCFRVDSQVGYIKFLLIISVLIIVIKNIYLIVQYHVQYKFICRSRMHLQIKLLSSYIQKPYAYFLNTNSGDIVRTISLDADYTFQLLEVILSFFTEIIVAVVVAITIILMSPGISFGMVVILALGSLLIALVIKPKMRKYGTVIRKEAALSNTWLLQAINGIKSIKVSRSEKYFLENYSVHTINESEVYRKNRTLLVMPRMLLEAFSVAGVLTLMFVMVCTGVELTTIVPQLTAFVVAAVRLLPSVNRVSSAINRVPYYEESLDHIIHITQGNDKTELVTENEVCSKLVETNKLKFDEKVIFDNISFSYSKNSGYIFKNSSFTINKGESVGIIGKSGSGKTTAIDIVLGLLQPTSGKITVDGVDIRQNMQGWLRCLAYIPQTIFLIDDSIRKNVAFGLKEENISDEKVWNALEEAQLKGWVMKLPDGLDTQVGESGVKLSGGQRQRIGIARALYFDPEILFFDEATSALDNETESAIMESIESLKGDKTLVIIAHRLTTIEKCDKVINVSEGNIFEE